MFGHDSFVWTPVRVFHAATEAPAGHTGSFVYIQKGKWNTSPRWNIWNEDMSPYKPNHALWQSWYDTKEAAIQVLPDGSYYKIGTGAKQPETKAEKKAKECEGLFRKLEIMPEGGLHPYKSGERYCGDCIDGYQEEDEAIASLFPCGDSQKRFITITEDDIPSSFRAKYEGFDFDSLIGTTSMSHCEKPCVPIPPCGSGYELDENGNCVFINGNDEGEGMNWGIIVPVGALAVIGWFLIQRSLDNRRDKLCLCLVTILFHGWI